MNKQSRIRGIKHILNQNRRKSAKYPVLANPYYGIDDDGKNVQVSCDGFRCAVLRDFVEVSEVENRNGVFPNWKKFADVHEIMQNGSIVELPDINELKEYVKAYKKVTKRRMTFDFGENLPYINAEFLIDAMEIVDLKTSKAYASGYKNICLLIIDAAGNYVYTMGIIPKGEREKTDLSTRYEEIDGKYIKVTT